VGKDMLIVRLAPTDKFASFAKQGKLDGSKDDDKKLIAKEKLLNARPCVNCQVCVSVCVVRVYFLCVLSVCVLCRLRVSVHGSLCGSTHFQCWCLVGGCVRMHPRDSAAAETGRVRVVVHAWRKELALTTTCVVSLGVWVGIVQAALVRRGLRRCFFTRGHDVVGVLHLNVFADKVVKLT
jgi:hypothetical protein